jgi:hypothetical protein
VFCLSLHLDEPPLAVPPPNTTTAGARRPVRDAEKTTDYTRTMVLDVAVRALREAEVEQRNDGSMPRNCGDWGFFWSSTRSRGCVATWYNRLRFLFTSPLIYPAGCLVPQFYSPERSSRREVDFYCEQSGMTTSYQPTISPPLII